MNVELRNLIASKLTDESYGGPFLSIVEKGSTYPAVRYTMTSDVPMGSKDASLNGTARFQIDVFAKSGELSTQSGPQDVAERIGKKISELNGYLGDDNSEIIEIRVQNRSMDYDEQFELHIYRQDFVIQHK